jgi:hypothetical protein
MQGRWSRPEPPNGPYPGGRVSYHPGPSRRSIWRIESTPRLGHFLSQLDTAQATITFPDTGTMPPVKTTSTRPGWLDPGMVGLVALLLGTLLLTIVRGRRCRRIAVVRVARRSEVPHSVRAASPAGGSSLRG